MKSSKSKSPGFFHRHGRKLAIVAVTFVVFVGIAIAVLSPKLTPYLEGDSFREEMNKQTSKGLHFKGAYEPISRTGFLTGASSGFKATDGVKAMKSLSAEGITAKFNPWGIFLRRWQLDYVHLDSGEVEVQTYKPKPDNKPPKPWYSIFTPDRVYLCEVVCEKGNVTWRVKDEKGGFFGTKVVITPYGRDFNYAADGGMFKMKPLPELKLRKLRMRITKQEMSIYELNLGPEDGGDGFIKLMGKAGMKEDKSVDARLKFQDMPLAPWAPKSWTGKVRGVVTGEIHWVGSEQKIEASSGDGFVKISGARLLGIPPLEYAASAAREKSLEDVALDECSIKFKWKYPRFELTDISVSAKGVFALEGGIVLEGNSLSGTVQLGVNPKDLDWLPKAREQIFTRSKDGLIWTTVKLSGSPQKPINDLTPRLEKVLKESPGAAMGLFFRSTGEWIEQKLKGD